MSLMNEFIGLFLYIKYIEPLLLVLVWLYFRRNLWLCQRPRAVMEARSRAGVQCRPAPRAVPGGATTRGRVTPCGAILSRMARLARYIVTITV